MEESNNPELFDNLYNLNSQEQRQLNSGIYDKSVQNQSSSKYIIININKI